MARIIGAVAAFVVAGIATSAGAGTFERWIGSPVGWVSNDAERATLTKRVERFRATLPGHAGAIENGEADSEVWLHLGCRARDPAEAPTVWINLPDHPEQRPAPHWATEPIDFVLTLARHGEFETVPVEMRAESVVARAKIVRRRVIGWTESDRPWLSIEFDEPARTGVALLDMIAGEAGPGTIVLTGTGARMELHPRWNAADQALARDMTRHCPRE